MRFTPGCDCCQPPNTIKCTCGTRKYLPLNLKGTFTVSSGPDCGTIVGTQDFIWGDHSQESHCRPTSSGWSWTTSAVVQGYNFPTGIFTTTSFVLFCGFDLIVYNERFGD